MKFIDREHEVFWDNLYKEMKKYAKTDVYYQAIVYTLGICPITRENFGQIFNLKTGDINIDSISARWQTSSSQKVTRIAFSLWKRCVYDSTEDMRNDRVSENYNVSEIFSCDYAPYFVEALKIRYPEYFKECKELKRKNDIKVR